MSCRSGCPTQDHPSWGACARASNIQIGDLDASVQRRWDAELNAYTDARRQGIQPAGTSMAQVQAAVEKSNQTGVAFDASTYRG